MSLDHTDDSLTSDSRREFNRQITHPGCRVLDDGRPGPCGLHLDEHNLSPDGQWIHPTGLNEHGRWVFDEEEL